MAAIYTQNKTIGEDWELLTTGPSGGTLFFESVVETFFFAISDSLPATNTTGHRVSPGERQFVNLETNDQIYVRAHDDSANLSYTFTDGFFKQGLDKRIYTGLQAFTTQPFIEANVKNSTEWELSFLESGLGAGLSIDSILSTGSQTVLVKSRQIAFNNESMTADVFEGTTFTGGTPATIYNMNRVTPNAPEFTVTSNVSVTTTGTQIAATTFGLGGEGAGNRPIGSFAVTGVERVLKPNTDYLLRITNTAAVAQDIAVYATLYEGPLSPDIVS